MSEQRLWAPWRLEYIQGGDAEQEKLRQDRLRAIEWPAGADPDCFFCRGLADRHDRENLIVYRGAHCLVVLNRYPYQNGHLLIAPLRHVGQLSDLKDVEHLAIQHQLTRLIGVLQERMQAEGFNVGLNLGRVAGAGVPGHLHWHLLPRWGGDHNFMPTLAGTHVISQSLDALWELLHDADGETE